MALDETLKAIDKVLGTINTHPEYSSQVRREVSNTLLAEAAYHSYSIETRAEQGRPDVNAISPRQAKEQIMRGWEHLARYGISIGTLADLGHLVDPKGNPTQSFRNEEVLFGPFAPPESAKVHQLVDNLIYRLQTTPEHPIIRAAEAHIELVKIHPYKDGNGRIARLLQAFCLQERGQPPAIIQGNERGTYLGILAPVLKDRYEHNNGDQKIQHEQLFYEFIAGKVLGSAERLHDELQKRRPYEITIERTNSPGEIYTLAKIIRKGLRVTAKIHDNNGHKHSSLIDVTGDVSQEDLERTVEQFKRKHSHNLRIRVQRKL